jgi:hypothetical protein
MTSDVVVGQLLTGMLRAAGVSLAEQLAEYPDVREEDLLVTAENTLTVGTARVRLRVTLEVTDPATEEVG